MIGRNDVTGLRDVKIIYFPRSPWRCSVASEGRARGLFARLARGRTVSFSYQISPNFFYKRFQFPFLPHSSFFCCKLNTDEVMSAYKRRLQLCFRGGSAAGEQQAPPIKEQRKCIVNSGRCVFCLIRLSVLKFYLCPSWKRSRREFEKEVYVSRERQRERERERENKREREIRERKRDREREKRNKQKHGCYCHLVWHSSMDGFCFSLFSRRLESTLTNENIRVRSAIFFPISHVRLSFLVNCQGMTAVCMTVASTRSGTRELDLRCWDKTGLELFHSASTINLQERSGDRMFVRTTGHMVRHKSSKLNSNRFSKDSWSFCRARGVCGLAKHCRDREWACYYGTPW